LNANDFLSCAGHEQDREAPATFHGVGSKKLLDSCYVHSKSDQKEKEQTDNCRTAKRQEHVSSLTPWFDPPKQKVPEQDRNESYNCERKYQQPLL
jgi:hypothetical protein